MTATPATISADAPLVAAQRVRADQAVRIWLWVVALFVLAMVIVGGATRLTDSGLSITEWKPIHGAIPPLSHAEWLEEFEKYRQIPEYQQINRGMSLDEFKFIFWWEWGHRLLGRLVGFVFLVPFVVFAAKGYICRDMLPRIGGLFLLGGLQGAIGWWMVSSGLTERVDVAQYRLATHLTLAAIIFAATVWIAEGLRREKPAIAEPRALFGMAKGLMHLTLLQIFLGGLVAGLDAGLVYNTWPLMEGSWIPEGLFFYEPWWINFLENHMTVQFVHRIGAYLLLALAIGHLAVAFKRAVDPATVRRAGLILALVSTQAVIGILTLLYVVPLWLALAHQGFAIVLLGAIVVHARRLKDGIAEERRVVAATA